MDSSLYKAAMNGNIGDGDFLRVQLKKDEEAGYKVTPKGNTVLHVAALYGHAHFAQNVLTIAPPLLSHQNKKKETALHIAANEGHTEVVRVLLNTEHLNLIMRMRDGVGDTALHKAVRNQHIDVVKLLVKQDPDFQFQANNAGKTPLYLSAETGFHDALLEILTSCNTPIYMGPCQRTPLHAAIINRYTDCAKSLWEWNRCLCEEADIWGWNSLHYAVKLGLKEVVSDMLGWNKSLAYLPAGSENDEWTTTFHIAAKEGYVGMMEELLNHCPDCWEMLDSRDQNALHVSILSNQVEVTKFLLSVPEFDNLVSEADNDGNTPIHLLAASGNYVPELVDHPKARMTPFNKELLPPNEMNWKDQPKQKVESVTRDDKVQQGREKRNKRIENILKATQVHVIVGTLIVTVTFAAGFTLPGGFESNPGPNEGMAILIRKAAFKAFVVTDVIAFVCSAGAVFSYFGMSANAAFLQHENAVLCLYVLATILQFFGMAALVIAFITGMYATLAHSVALSIAVSVIGCLSFLIYGGMLYATFNWKAFRP